MEFTICRVKRVVTMSKSLAILGLLAVAVSFTSSPSYSQAYVNQANPGVDSVYLNQIPPGAKPRPPAINRPAKRPVVQKSPAASAAMVASSSAAPRYPNVASGSSAAVRASVTEWPSVGRGAVNR